MSEPRRLTPEEVARRLAPEEVARRILLAMARANGPAAPGVAAVCCGARGLAIGCPWCGKVWPR